jgi:hypothetical protein
VKKVKSEDDNTNHQSRADKKYAISYSESMFFESIIAGYKVTEYSWVTLSYGEFDFQIVPDFEPPTIEKYEVSYKNIWDSFYVEGSLFFLSYDETSTYTELTDDGNATSKFNISFNCKGYAINIGNNWQWDNGLFIDANWISVGQLKDVSIETSYGLPTENEELNSTRNELEERFSSHYFDLFKISFG